MNPQNPFDDPKLVTELAQTFDSIWLVMRAHEPFLDANRAKELSIEISRKLVELAADGVTDPTQASETYPGELASLPATLARSVLTLRFLNRAVLRARNRCRWRELWRL